MESVWTRVCALAILCVVAGQLLKQMKSELAGLLRIGGVVLILGAVVAQLSEVLGQAALLLDADGVRPYASVMLRALGIALLTRICTDLCRDSGESTVANGVELAGKAAILALCLPLVAEIIGYAATLLEME
ncbi:MAG: hypothetical protein E7668_04880 [Ruminococcaceae bacterium]|nr:hypothetical protein [Oscillospiraceae bacterium]